MTANIDILATYSGQQALGVLELQLSKINGLSVQSASLNKIAQVQNQIQIQQTGRQNAMLRGRLSLTDQEIQNLGVQNALNKQLTFQTENRLRVATEGAILRSQYAKEGIALSFEEARVATVANNEIIASEQALAQQMAVSRRAMMHASISLFVLNISMGQMVSSLKPLVEGNEGATKAIEGLQAALMMALGPMQAFMAVQMIMMNTGMGVTQMFKLMGGALLASIGLMGVMTTKSAGLRVAFAALVGIGTLLAATQFLASVATFSSAGAFATLQAVLGNPMGMIALFAGAAATAYVVGTVLASQSKAQVLTGHRKRVRSGGIAILDDDEVVTRETKDTRGMDGGITIILPESYTGTLSDARITAETVRRYTQTGQGAVKFKRRVTPNG